MSKKQISNIDCFKMVFPESDPQAAAVYEKMMHPLFEFEEPDLGQKVPFSSEVEICCLPDVTASRTRATASRFTRTVRTIARSATDDILVVFYTKGHFTYRIGAETRRVEQGELAFFDLSQEIVIEAPSVENVRLSIQRHQLESVVPLLDSAHGFVVPSGALSGVLIGMMKQIMKLGPKVQPSEARSVAEAVLLLVVACLDTISQPKSTAGGSVSLAILKSAIERRLTDPSQKTQRVSQLAFELGFTHASAFTRSFKALFGISPNDIRRLAARPAGKDIRFMISPAAIPYIRSLQAEA